MRPALLTARHFVVLAAAALLWGCGGGTPQGETYALPADQVREALLDTDAPIQVFGSRAVDWKTAREGDDTVIWTVIGDDDRPLMRFGAKMVAVKGGTRVDVEVLPPEGKNKERVAKGIAEHPEIRDLYHVAMTEEIDAKLEHRGFDGSRIAMATVRAASANMKSISASLDEAVKEEHKRDAENVARAYASERKAKFGTYGNDNTPGPRTFGAPMDNPNVR